jgi:cytoskeleton protein RodZ
MRSVNLREEPTQSQVDDTGIIAFKDVGEILADARKEQHLSIKQVASKIHIRQRYLIDLEEGNLADLPGRVYVFGFIRNYARFLGLDGEELIRRMNALPNMPSYEQGHTPAPIPSEEEPSYIILGVSAVIIVVLAIGGYFFLRPTKQITEVAEIETQEIHHPPIDSKQEPYEPLSQDLKPKILPSENPPQAQNDLLAQRIASLAAPSQEKKGVSSLLEEKAKLEKDNPSVGKQVILIATEPSWLEVRDETNRILFMRVMKRGEEYVVPDKPGVTFSTGNAGGMTIYVGKKELPSLGGRGEVKRGIRIDSLQ